MFIMPLVGDIRGDSAARRTMLSESRGSSPPGPLRLVVRIAVVAILTGATIARAQEPLTGAARTIRVELVSPSGARVDDMRVVVDWGAIADTATRDSLGLSVPWRVPIGDSAIVHVEPASPASAEFAARIALASGQLTPALTFVVVPREWRIAGGTFERARIAIDPTAALRRAPRGGSFGRLRKDRVVGWDPGSFPIPMMLLRGRGSGVTSSDSVDFWNSVARVEAALGATFFRPASDTGFTGHIYPIVVRVDPRLTTEGLTFVSWGADGEIFEGSTSFRRAADVADASIVGHELLHLLGFGHTAAWPSTLAVNAAHPMVVTAEDAAYAQLLVGLRALQVQRNAFGGLQSTLNAMSYAR